MRLAKQVGVDLRQTYVRVGKLALIKHQRYAHAKQFKQFKQANRALRKLETYLGQTIRDIARRSPRRGVGRDLEMATLPGLGGSGAPSAPARPQDLEPACVEVEFIGKGNAPYEFGVKVSLATTLERSKGGQFTLHAKALPGNPYYGYTLATIIPDMEKTIGNEIGRILADAGSRPQCT